MKRILFSIILAPIFVFSQDSKLANIKSVNFIQEGEVSKLIIDFDATVFAEKNHIKSDKQIILDLKNVNADKKFLRGIDTSEFSGSTVFVSPYKKPGSSNDIRFAIQLRDNVRSFLEEKGTRLVLNIENRFGVFSRAKLQSAKQNEEVTKQLAKGEKLLVPKSNKVEDIIDNLTQSGVKRYVGRKISINVNNMPIPEVLKMIGDTSGFNIIITKEVQDLAPITISLVNLPWDQVLDTIMNIGGLVAEKYGNILTIRTEEVAKKGLKEQLKETQEEARLEPLVTKVFPISFAKVEDLKAILDSYITPERGSVQFDNRTQNMIIRDTVNTIERLSKIIDTLDTQTPQVLIEAKLVEANESYQFRAGLREGVNIGYDALGNDAILNAQSRFPSDPGSGIFSLNTAPNPARSLLSATVNVARLVDLNFSLELMESENKGKVITSPRVITENNKEATIIDTTERSFIVSAPNDNGIRTPELERLQASISLKVIPKVTNEGTILLNVEILKTGFGEVELEGELPPTNQKTVKTNVLVSNGSTIVIGGLYQTEDSELITGIPFLKDLPLIGWLFRSAYNPQKIRRELIVFLTPRIINQEEAGLVNRELRDDLGI